MLKVDEFITCGKEPDALYIRWLDYDPIMKHNFEATFFHIIDRIKKSQIKKLVLDTSGRQHHPSESDFREIFELFMSGLSETELEKFARICSPDSKINRRFQEIMDSLEENLDLKFKTKNFKNSEEAVSWLCQAIPQ